MQNETGCFLKGLGAVLAVLLALLLPAVLLGFNLSFVLLDEDVYKQALKVGDVYRTFPDVVADENLTEEQFDEPLYSPEYADAYRELTIEVFDGGWLQAEIEKILEDFFAYINGDTPELHTSLSFAPMLELLQSKEGAEIIRAYLLKLPECSADDFQNELERIQEGDHHLPYCSPPQAQFDRVIELVQDRYADDLEGHEADTLIDIVPDAVGQEDLANYRLFRQVLLYSPLLVLALLMGIVLLAVRSVDELLNWTGIPLGVGSLFALLTALLGYLYAQDGLQQGVVEITAEDTSPRIAELLGGVAAEAFGIYFRTALIEAGVLLVLSVGAIMLALVIGRMQAGVE